MEENFMYFYGTMRGFMRGSFAESQAPFISQPFFPDLDLSDESTP